MPDAVGTGSTSPAAASRATSRPRIVAACPAASASSASTITPAKRLSSFTWCSVSAVPRLATTLSKPAACARMTSV